MTGRRESSWTAAHIFEDDERPVGTADGVIPYSRLDGISVVRCHFATVDRKISGAGGVESGPDPVCCTNRFLSSSPALEACHLTGPLCQAASSAPTSLLPPARAASLDDIYRKHPRISREVLEINAHGIALLDMNRF